MDLWVVIPAYNEARAIGAVIADVQRVTSNIAVIDDGSTDDTGRVARAAGAVVLRHVLNRGQGAALQTGIEYALLRGASIITTFDSDGQHSADDLNVLVAPIVAGDADIVLGSRFLGRGASAIPPLRRQLLRAATRFTRAVSGVQVTDTHNGLRAFSRAAAQRIRIRLDRMAHASELIDQIHSSGFRYVEVPVEVRYTEYSRAKGQRGIHALRVAFDYLIGKWVR
jgi:glycosyltransferase involved in cell wall biosynthesis